jgi:regulator of sigma E protease
MFSLIVFLIVFSVLIIVHEFGHFITAKYQRVRVERFSLGFGWRLLKFRKRVDSTEYSINAIPLGGFVKLAGDNLEDYRGKPDEFYSKAPWQRALIVAFGSLLNYALGIFCFWMIFFAGYFTLTSKVGGLLEGYPAKEAGIQVGDKIISVDGKKIDSWEDLQMAIYNKDPASTAQLSILRDHKEYKIAVALKKKELDDELGQKRKVGLMGVTPNPDEKIKVRYGPWQSLLLSIKKSLSITVLTYNALWRIIVGKISLRESITGPLGIFYITSEAAHLGVSSVLNLIGLLSISLAIFNLLPLPILDGGHLLLLGIEKIRGRRLSIKAEQILNQVGMTLIATLAIIVTYNDFLRFKDKIFSFFIK